MDQQAEPVSTRAVCHTFDNVIRRPGTLLPTERAKIPFGEAPRIGEANFYFTMQPANPALLARSAYKFGKCQATADADIIAYHLFAVDVDPVRPSGISATDAEKKEAALVGQAIKHWLWDRGVDSIAADSGNGFHLLVPTIPYLDVPVASQNAKSLLHLLDNKFSTATAKVDTTIYNAGRILKLYGTKSVKGSSIPERPHRYARISMKEIPDDVDLFDVLKTEMDAFSKASEVVAVKPTTSATTTKATKSTKPVKAIPNNTGDGWNADTSNQVMAGVLDKSGLTYRVKHKGGDTLYEFEECPHHDDPDGDTYECCVIVRGDGSFAAKCQHDADATWKEHFKPKIGWETHGGAVPTELGHAPKSVPYQATPGGIVRMKSSADGVVKTPLTNFTAKIVSDIAEDDGVETRHTFKIEGVINGQVKQFVLNGADFSGMNWPIEQLGAQAIVYPGLGNKDHARAAIQLLSGDVPSETVYTHLGWRKHGGVWVYLHAGGALGADGPVQDVKVHLGETFSRFKFPEPTSQPDLVKAVRASLKLLDVAPDAISVPLFAAIWRAAIGGTDFSLHLTGQSGTGKSELAALVQQHWGSELDARHLPASWSSTANATEALAFLAKDAVLVVDDFAPTGSQYDIQRKHQEADRLLRGQGNSSGRNRMRADTTLRPPKPPRGMMVSTGEDVPRGQSLRARMLVIDVTPVSVDWKRLSKRQQEASAGLYATALGGFVHWLAKDYASTLKQLQKDLPEIRNLASASEQHKRTPNIVADMFSGLGLFRNFAVACGAMTKEQGEELMYRGWTALGEAAAAQKGVQTDSEPVQRFIELLNAALAAGKAHVASATGIAPKKPQEWGWRCPAERWEPQGSRVGWVDGDDLYLEPEAAFGVVQGMAGGEPLAIGSKTLSRRLHDQKLLKTVDATRKRLTIRHTLESKRREVLHLGVQTLSGN